MAWPFVDPGEWLIRGAAAGALLLLAGTLALLGVRQPSRRQRLGELAMCSALAAAALSFFPPWSPISLGLLAPAAVPGADGVSAELPPSQAALSFSADLGDDVWYQLSDDSNPAATASPSWLGLGQRYQGHTASAAAGQITLEPAQLSPERAAAPHPPRGADTSGKLAWTQTAGAICWLIAAGLLGWCAVGYVGLRRLRRTSQPVPGVIADVFAELTQDWRNPPLLRLHPRVRAPLSFGLFRPIILLPEAYSRQAARSALLLVLTHELTHLRRRDAWSRLLLAVSQALFFYVPWFWWLRRQVRLCQEYIADAAAARLSNSVDYAEYLVTLSARTPRAMPAGIRAMGILGTPSDLYRRVAMLLTSRNPLEGACPRWLSWVASIGFIGAAVLVSGVGLRAHADPGPAKPELLTVHARLTVEEAEDEKGEPRRCIILIAPTADGVPPLVRAHILGGKELSVDQTIKDLEAMLTRVPNMKGLTEAERAKLTAQLTESIEQLKKARAAEQPRVFYLRITPPAPSPEQTKLAEDLKKSLEQVDRLPGLTPAQRDAIKKQLKDALEQLEGVRQKLELLRKEEPSDRIVRIVREFDVARTLPTQRGFRLGVAVEPPSPALAAQLDLAKGQGLVIQSITPDSPAAKAGLQVNDILLTLGGKEVPSDPAAFQKLIGELKTDSVEATVLRKGKKVTVKGLTLGAAAPRDGRMGVVFPFAGPRPAPVKRGDLLKQIPPDVLKQLPPEVIKRLEELDGKGFEGHWRWDFKPPVPAWPLPRRFEIEVEGLDDLSPEIRKQIEKELEELKKMQSVMGVETRLAAWNLWSGRGSPVVPVAPSLGTFDIRVAPPAQFGAPHRSTGPLPVGTGTLGRP